jgi:hypothetical protein
VTRLTPLKSNDEHEIFGQAVSERQLTPMAREITVRIGDGRPASVAGFAVTRSPGTRPANPASLELFSDYERARLQFLRWLLLTGRLASQPSRTKGSPR